MDHYEDQGISLAEIWDKLWAHKYLIIIITGVITLVLGIGSYFLLKGSQITETGFEYNFVGVDSNEYPDGTLFEFRDLVSYDKLLEIKNSSALFADIDVESMYLNDNTKIVRQESVYSTTTEIQFSNNRYTLSIPYKYFDYNGDLAESFIMTLIESIITEADQKNADLALYDYTNLINNNTEYLDVIGYYNSQYTLLINSMNNFISTYGDVTYHDVNITAMKEELTSTYNNGYSFTDLSTLVKQNIYYKNSTLYTNKLNVRIETYNEEIYLNTLKIAELETTYNNLVSTSNLEQANQILSDIVDYRIANVDYQYKIDQYQEIIDEMATSGLTAYVDQTFLNALEDIDILVSEYTDTFNDFYISYVNEDTRVVYDTGSIYSVEGGYSIIITGLVSGFVGLITSFVVVFIKESEFYQKTLAKS